MIELFVWSLLVFGISVIITELSIFRFIRMFIFKLKIKNYNGNNNFIYLIFSISNSILLFIQEILKCTVCVSFWVGMFACLVYNPVYVILQVETALGIIFSGVLGMSITAIFSKQSVIF